MTPTRSNTEEKQFRMSESIFQIFTSQKFSHRIKKQIFRTFQSILESIRENFPFVIAVILGCQIIIFCRLPEDISEEDFVIGKL